MSNNIEEEEIIGRKINDAAIRESVARAVTILYTKTNGNADFRVGSNNRCLVELIALQVEHLIYVIEKTDSPELRKEIGNAVGELEQIPAKLFNFINTGAID